MKVTVVIMLERMMVMIEKMTESSAVYSLLRNETKRLRDGMQVWISGHSMR
jgi:hypothetical protein